MKTIVFHINVLLAGGIEKVLIDLLCALDPSRYHTRLSIGHYLGEKEILKSRIPAHVEICYILDAPILTATKKKKVAGNINVAEKLFEDLILPQFKKRVHRQKLKVITKDADVIIDFDMTLAPYYSLFKHKQSIAYCHFSLAHYHDGKKRKLDKLAKRLDKYDKVIMLCDEMKDDAANMYPFLSRKLVRLYNALDIKKIRTLGDAPINEDLNTAFIVSVGRLQESQKDFTSLLKAYALCVTKYSIKEKLVIVGDGPNKPALQQLARDENVSDRVLFVGFQDNPYKWISKSKLFAFSSKFEGLPTVLIEALALGRPIVATSCPTGVKEILLYGKAGLLVTPGDINALAEGINELLSNPELQKSYRENAIGLLGQFDIKNVISQFENLIN